MAIELVSFDELAPILGLGKTETNYPDLTIIQESVVAMFENHVDRIFKKSSHVEDLFLYSNTRMLPLKGLPVIAITSITEDGVTLGVDTYGLRPYGVELNDKKNGVTIQLSYTGGFTSVPADLKRAALLQTVYEYQNKNSIGLEVVSTNGGTVSKPQLGMLKEVERLLNKYVHPFPRF